MIDIHEMTVLIVDDMPSMCKFVHKMMRTVGYGGQFLFANDGKGALDILKKEPVDLLMLDYSMPEMSGGELLSIIREDRNLRDMPVIMVTAEATMEYVAEIGEIEVDAYIIKPITVKVLEEKVAEVIENDNNPPPMVVHLKNSRRFEEEGDLDSAIDEARKAMDANPNATRPIRELGYFHYLKGDLKEAEKWLLNAAELNQLDVFAFHYLGEIYIKFRDIEKAAYYLEKAMKISPRHLDRGINFGKTLVQMELIPKAVQVFEKTLELSGSTPELIEEVADFCMMNGVNEYAVKLLESIIIEQPKRADLLFKLGMTLENLSEIKKAITYLNRASEIDKENVNIKIHLARDYLSLQKPILAEKPLKEIIHINPENELARELLKQCA